jgi:hypothetical protein
LALGENVRIVVDGTCLAISKDTGATALTAAQRERLRGLGAALAESDNLNPQ